MGESDFSNLPLPGAGYADTPGPCPICKRPGTYVDVGMKDEHWRRFAKAWARVGDHVAWVEGSTVNCLDWPWEETRLIIFWDATEERWLRPPVRLAFSDTSSDAL